MVILDQLQLREAQLVADRLRTAISSLSPDNARRITVSIGLAHASPQHPPPDLQQLLTRADTALYQAKTSGRDRVHPG